MSNEITEYCPICKREHALEYDESTKSLWCEIHGMWIDPWEYYPSSDKNIDGNSMVGV